MQCSAQPHRADAPAKHFALPQVTQGDTLAEKIESFLQQFVDRVSKFIKSC
jgi:hypothetical protein